MVEDAKRFVGTTDLLRDGEPLAVGPYLHEYEGVSRESDETVRVVTIAPELADNEAATDAFARVTGQWYSANTHPNIRTLAERGTTPRPWVALPRVDAQTLDTAQPRLTPGDVETVITDTAEALRTLHLYNAVHGALTPDDVLVPVENGERAVRVGGFGLERAVRAAVEKPEPTPYTAPELITDPDQPTAETDVYGLGAVAYYALTGRPPRTSGDPPQTAIRDGEIEPPSTHATEVSAEVDDVVMRALARRPSERYGSSYAFQTAITQALPDVSDTAEPSPDPAESDEEPNGHSDGEAEQAIPDDSDGTPAETVNSDAERTGGAVVVISLVAGGLSLAASITTAIDSGQNLAVATALFVLGIGVLVVGLLTAVYGIEL